ncbi:hypothetical protein MaudCBS49596_008000 [Microsporum audouinii]
MKSTSLLLGSLILAVPALAFEPSTIQSLRVATAAAGVAHSKFPQAVEEGPEAAISNISSAAAQAADESSSISKGLNVQSRNNKEQCGQLVGALKGYFKAIVTLSHDSTNPAVFCSKNIDRLGPTIGWNLHLVNLWMEPYSTTIKRDCEDGEKLVAGLVGDYDTAIDSIEKARKLLESPGGRCNK